MIDTVPRTLGPVELSILDALDSEKAIIKLGSSRDPMMIYNQNATPGQEITFLLMPLRS